MNYDFKTPYVYMFKGNSFVMFYTLYALLFFIFIKLANSQTLLQENGTLFLYSLICLLFYFIGLIFYFYNTHQRVNKSQKEETILQMAKKMFKAFYKTVLNTMLLFCPASIILSLIINLTQYKEIAKDPFAGGFVIIFFLIAFLPPILVTLLLIGGVFYPIDLNIKSFYNFFLVKTAIKNNLTEYIVFLLIYFALHFVCILPTGIYLYSAFNMEKGSMLCLYANIVITLFPYILLVASDIHAQFIKKVLKLEEKTING